MSGIVYGLVDYSDGWYYVGKTTNATQRKKVYEKAVSHNFELNQKIVERRNMGREVFFKVLEEDIPIEKLDERERFWIQHFIKCGDNLFNVNIRRDKDFTQ